MENIIRNDLKILKIGIAQNNVKLNDFNTKVLYKKTPELDKDKSISISECMELIKKSNNKKVISKYKEYYQTNNTPNIDIPITDTPTIDTPTNDNQFIDVPVDLYLIQIVIIWFNNT